MAAARRSPRSLPTVSARSRGGGEAFSHAQVAQIQRARILSAMCDVACERGAGNVSVAHVVERSGVSRRTFYQAFLDREDCFLAAFEDALSLAAERVLLAYRVEDEWNERIRAGLIALLVFLDEEPVVGRLLVVESLSGGRRALERRARALGLMATAIDEGRRPHAVGLPPLTAEGLVGGALSVVHARISQPDHEPLVELANQLVSMIVLPYRGKTSARRELERSMPLLEGEASARLVSDPFKDAGMRLTYRTARALVAIGELGGQKLGASNRQVGERAGISDQGQISKLLGRLERGGLIVNSGIGPGMGAPNEWSLTPKGSALVGGILAHTEDSR